MGLGLADESEGAFARGKGPFFQTLIPKYRGKRKKVEKEMKREGKTRNRRLLGLAGRSLMLAAVTGLVSMAAGGMTSLACTSYYAGKDVTTDGSILFGRTEDISAAHNKIFVVHEAKTHEAGEMYEDGTGFTMPYPEQTYRFTACEDDPGYEDGPFGEVGTNEYGVSMSATESIRSAAALREQDPLVRGTGITESSMVNVILPCVKTAREGIELMAEIVDTYGSGEGNSLMIGDRNECWYMEILTGHQYVAIKMPDDKVAIMPNCIMLEEVDLADTENVIASKDLMKVAEDAGTLVKGNSDSVIHVRKSYSAAMGEANSYRIWGGQIILNENLLGKISPDNQELPMFIEPSEKVSVKTMYRIAGSRYEGTEYEEQGRVIGSSGSVECHILQVRPDMPVELETVEWLCMGSADLSTFIPYYSAAITDTHPAYQIQDLNYNEDSAYWTFRSLAAMSASSRTYVAANVKAYWSKYMDDLIARQADVDEKMMALYQENPAAVSQKATNLGMAVAEDTINSAKTLYAQLQRTYCNNDGTFGAAFIPQLETDGIYSNYSYDLTYGAAEPEPEPDPTPDVKPDTKPQTPSTDTTVTEPAAKQITAGVPKKVKAKAGKKKATVSFKKVSKAVSYRIQYSTSKKFAKKKTKTLTVKTNKKVIKKLKSGKTYYVRVAANWKVNNVTIKGAYGNAVKVKVK